MSLSLLDAIRALYEGKHITLEGFEDHYTFAIVEDRLVNLKNGIAPGFLPLNVSFKYVACPHCETVPSEYRYCPHCGKMTPVSLPVALNNDAEDSFYEQEN